MGTFFHGELATWLHDRPTPIQATFFLNGACIAATALPNAFVVPGANPVSAALDVARSLARRAERRVVELRDRGETVSERALRYLNRLSDLLFVLARVLNAGADVYWNSERLKRQQQP